MACGGVIESESSSPLRMVDSLADWRSSVQSDPAPIFHSLERIGMSPVDEQGGGAERGASLWTARGLTPLFPRLGSDAQIHSCSAKQRRALRARGAFPDFAQRPSAKPKRSRASALQSLAALAPRSALAGNLPLNSQNHARHGMRHGVAPPALRGCEAGGVHVAWLSRAAPQ